jgi:hypothetical protein
MGGIFINYRRSAPDGLVTRIFQQLTEYFGAEQVFLDRASIRLGQTYWDEIHARLLDTDVLLVLVHREWLTEQDEHGTPLLERDRDWVREEIEVALKTGKKIVPVVLDAAEWNADADLPESIRPIRGNQSHRVCAESAPADVDELITRLRSDVAPTWTPGDGGDEQPFRPGRWLVHLTGLLSLLVLAGPAILVRNDSPAGFGELPSLVPVAGQLALVTLAVPVVFWFVHVPLGKIVGSWEWEVHRAPTDRYNRMAPLIMGMFLVVLVWLAIKADMTDAGQLFVLVSLFIAVMRASVIMLRNERKDRDLDDRWPHTLGRPLRALAVRRSMVRLDHRLTTWHRRLSREQEDKAAWMFGQFTQAAQILGAEAARPRSRWLFDDHRWGLSGYTLWISATTGLLAASAVPELRAGTDTIRLWLLLGIVFAVMCLAAVLTVELGYRQQRRWRRRLIQEIADNLARFQQQLDLLTSPPPWDARRE